jgi:tRNA pseudouridine38-40 synthase
MQNYKMCIAYDGRKYKGFNVTKRDAEKNIQGKLEAILSKMYDKEVEVIGAVNTDAGVHAKEQIVNFVAPTDQFAADEIVAYIEKYLTDDIIVLAIEAVDERFHSRYLTKGITYTYRIWKQNAPNRPLFERHYVNLMNQVLDSSKMKKAAGQLIGMHDFSAFTTNKRVKNPMKDVMAVTIEETRHEIIITMTASSFLLNMERIIVGTLIQVGLGQLPINTIDSAIKTKDLKHVGHKASADALCLTKVTLG